MPLAAIPIGIFILFSLHSPEPRNSQGLREYLGGAWGSIKNIKVASAFMAGVIAFLILYGPQMTYLSLFLGASFQASPFIIGCFLSAASFTTALAASQLGRMVKITSETNLVKLGFVIQAIALILVPFMPQLGLMVVPAIIFGAGGGILIPSLQTYIAGKAPTEYRGAFMAINAMMFRLGQTLGPLLFGLFYAYGNFEGVYLFGAGILLLAALVGFVGGRIIR